MTGVITDMALERDTEAEEAPAKLESLIAEGYIEDDYIPSVFLEDIGGDKEVWLLDCPDTIDLKTLLGKELNFSNKKSLITNDVDIEKFIFVPKKDEQSLSCLFYSCSNDKLKTVSIQSVGNIRLNVGYDIPELGSMMDDDPYVPFPKGLKVRHPFLSQAYNPVSIEREISATDYRQSLTCPKKMKSQPHPADVVSAIRESLKETENKEVLSPKKSKKRKRESNCEVPEESTEVTISGEHYHTSKKLKKENVNVFEDGYANNILGPRLSNIESKLNLSIKKKKKKHSHSKGEDDYVTAEEIPVECEDPQVIHDAIDHPNKHQRLSLNNTHGQELDIISEGNEHISKKAKRKSKLQCMNDIIKEEDGYANNILGPRLSNIESELNLSIKKKKKKHSHSKGEDDYVTAEEIPVECEDPQVIHDAIDHHNKHQRLSLNNTHGQELDIISEGNEHISKKAKRKSKLQYKNEIRNEEDGYSNSIMVLSSSNLENESGLSKQKNKKKHFVSDKEGYTMTEEYGEEKDRLQLVHNVGDGVFSKLVKIEKCSPQKTSRFSQNLKEDSEFYLVKEGNELNSKKRSKRKSININSEDTAMTGGDSHEENLVVVDDESAQMLKKKKKLKGKDNHYKEGSCIVSDSFQEEVEVIPHEGEKTLKNSKRDSVLKTNVSTLDSQEINDFVGHESEHIFKQAKKKESRNKDKVILNDIQEEASYAEVNQKVSRKIKKKKDRISALEGLELEANGKDAVLDNLSLGGIKKEKKSKKRHTMENAGDMNTSGIGAVHEEDSIGLWIPQKNL